MNQVTDWLYVGSVRDLDDLARLEAAGIGAILSLAWPVAQSAIVVRHEPFDDGAPIPDEILVNAVNFVRAQRRAGRKALIACSAGVSRAPSVAIAVLHELERIPLAEAFRIVLGSVHSAQPDPALWNSLCLYYGELVTVNDVWRRE
jgi:dual specificity MAP kinase phosphatase